MTKEKKIQNEPSDLQQIIQISQECFSFKGTLTRLHFWGFLVLGYVFYHFLSSTEIPYFEIIGWFCYFYIALSCYQKRCRDLNIKGTLIILGTSAFFIMAGIIRFLNVAKTDVLFSTFKIIFILYLGIYLYTQFMPGAKEKDINLTCPLLKHPNIYFITCIAIFSIAFWAINSFYQL